MSDEIDTHAMASDDEIDSNFEAAIGDTAVENSEVPSEDGLNTSLKKGMVLVLDESNTLRRFHQQEELLKHLQIKPKATTENEGALKALDHLQNKDVQKIQHFTSLGEYMKLLRNHKEICDIEIRIENNIFSAHRIALSCFSLYFSDLFSMRTGKCQVPMVIRMSGVSSEVFTVFLNFVYDRELNVNTDILGEVIMMSDSLSIHVLKEHCLKLLDNTSLKEAVMILRGKRLSRSSGLFAFAVSRIAEEFVHVYYCDDFFELDAVTVCLILSNDSLQITTEMDVFRVVLKWIGHSMNERPRYLSMIMKYVRFSHMTQKELFECFEEPMMKGCSEMKNIILHANWVITARTLHGEDPLNIPTLSPRTCFTEKQQRPKKKSSDFFSGHVLPEVRFNVKPRSSPKESTRDNEKTEDHKYGDILAIGAYLQYRRCSENKQVTLVQKYDPLKNQWTHYTDLPEPRFHHAATMLNGKMYLVGGYVPKTGVEMEVPTKDAFVFNCETKKWTKIEPMKTRRMHHSICSLHGMLYVIGGEGDKSRVLNSVECYNPLTNKWVVLNSMVTPRLGAGVSVLDGKIVVAGGFGQASYLTNDPVLRTVEVYDPKLNSWEHKNHLRFPRCYGNLVNVQGNLYLCGGATSSFATYNPVLTSVSSIDVYNKARDVWEKKTNLNIDRHYAGCAVSGDRIYIIGGVSTDANQILQSVECYDVTYDRWIRGINGLPHPARWLSCVTIPAAL